MKDYKFQIFLSKYWPIIFFFYDFITKILIHYKVTGFTYNYAIGFKTIILFFIINEFYSSNYVNHFKNNFFFKITIYITIVFLIGHLVLFNHLTIESVKYSLYYLLNSIVPILLIPVYLRNIKQLNKVILVFLWILFFNFFIILIGLIFKIELFESYFRNDNRFGYMGFLLYHWEVGYLYFMAAYVAREKYIITKKKKYRYFFITFLLALFFLGTKKGIFLAILYCLYLAMINYKFYLKNFKIIFVSMLFAIFFLKIIYSKLFKENWNLFYRIYKNEGFLTAFTSYRSDNLVEKLQPFLLEKWNVLNYFFGGAIFSEFKSELELVDLFMCFGLLGVIIYFFLIKRIIVNRSIIVLTILTVSAAIFSGNLFSSINVILFYFMIVSFLDRDNKIMIYT